MEQFTRGYWKMLENESYVNWFENVWICENCRHRFGKRPDQGHTMKKLLVEYLKPPTSSAIYYHMLDDFGYWDYWAFVLPIKKLSHSIYPIIISHIIPVLLVIYIYIQYIWMCIYIYIYIYIRISHWNCCVDPTYIYIYISLEIWPPLAIDQTACCNSDIWHGSARGSRSRIHSLARVSLRYLSLYIHRYR